jgi:hypothetical protein
MYRAPLRGRLALANQKIRRSWRLTTVAIGFTTVLGLAFDRDRRLYVLENTTGNPSPTPGTGKIVRIDGKNKVTEIATGLSLPPQ